MSDSTKDLKLLERQLRRLINAVIEKAQSDSDFARQLAKILNLSKAADSGKIEKATKTVFNAVDILHREGREALQLNLIFALIPNSKTFCDKRALESRRARSRLFATTQFLPSSPALSGSFIRAHPFLQTGT